MLNIFGFDLICFRLWHSCKYIHICTYIIPIIIQPCATFNLTCSFNEICTIYWIWLSSVGKINSNQITTNENIFGVQIIRTVISMFKLVKWIQIGHFDGCRQLIPNCVECCIAVWVWVVVSGEWWVPLFSILYVEDCIDRWNHFRYISLNSNRENNKLSVNIQYRLERIDIP